RAGARVLGGGRPPHLGALRATPTAPDTPSTQIQAHSCVQRMANRGPRTLPAAPLINLLVIGALGVVAIAAGAALSPAGSVLAIAVAVGLVWSVSLGLSISADRLLDPLL